MTKHPRTITIDTRPLAAPHPHEKIIEFSDSRGYGGLISFEATETRLKVSVYRTDPQVEVRAS